MSSQHERRNKLIHKGFMKGHTVGAKDALEELLKAHEAAPAKDVDEILSLVREMLVMLGAEAPIEKEVKLILPNHMT